MKFLSGGGKLALVLLMLSLMTICFLIFTSNETTVFEVIESASLSIFAASFTAVMLDILTVAVEQRHWLVDRLRDLASSDSGFSARALDQLREKGMLSDGTLSSKDLRRANLGSLNLREASLLDTKFDNGELQECDFRDAVLDGSSFRGANLIRAQFSGASLKGCDFREAILDEAELDGADCTDADFETASIKNVNWTNCIGRD